MTAKHACLDISPTEFSWRFDPLNFERFFFIAQGDPSVSFQTTEGVSWIKKNVVPEKEQGPKAYDLYGDTIIVQQTSLTALTKDLGLPFFHSIRVGGLHAEDLLREWPGPIAEHVVTHAPDQRTLDHLLQWYTVTIACVPRGSLNREARARFDLRGKGA